MNLLLILTLKMYAKHIGICKLRICSTERVSCSPSLHLITCTAKDDTELPILLFSPPMKGDSNTELRQ